MYKNYQKYLDHLVFIVPGDQLQLLLLKLNQSKFMNSIINSIRKS